MEMKNNNYALAMQGYVMYVLIAAVIAPTRAHIDTDI